MSHFLVLAKWQLIIKFGQSSELWPCMQAAGWYHQVGHHPNATSGAVISHLFANVGGLVVVLTKYMSRWLLCLATFYRYSKATNLI